MSLQNFRVLNWLCLLIIAAFAVGCGGPKDVPRAVVTGTITYQGEPIEEGFVIFVPAPGTDGAPVQLKIENGQFNSRTDPTDQRGVVIGQNLVEIYSNRETGRKVVSPDNEMIDEVVNFIPAKYNTETELVKTIEPGEQVINFDLN